MINFQIGALHSISGEVGLLVSMGITNSAAAEKIPNGENNPIFRDDPEHQAALNGARDEAKKTAALCRKNLSYLSCAHIDEAIASLEFWAERERPRWADLRMNAIALRKAIQTELAQYSYYQYPKNKAQVLRAWKDEWSPAIAALPDIEWDVFRATDCYALGHDIAAVFYAMRILESGLRMMAAEVGLTFDIQQWHNILDQIESRISAERKSLPKGTARNERLRFLSEAAKEFFYFKDGWRNHVAHGRANYDEHQALSVLIHVRTFMNHLAPRLSESLK